MTARAIIRDRPVCVPHSHPRRCALALAAALAAISVATPAKAQFAVIDVASIAHLVQQVQLLAQQLAQARAQLAQAQTLYQSMTGSRGMQALLSSSPANYLPADWASLQAARQGQGAFAGLAAGVSSAVQQNALLSPAQLALLSADEQATVSASRQDVALMQALVEQSLTNASTRFADIDRLSTAIGAATDQKSALELQNTLTVEQAMLLGEQTKLQVLERAVQVQEWNRQQRERELIIAGQGSFAARFEPVPN